MRGLALCSLVGLGALLLIRSAVAQWASPAVYVRPEDVPRRTTAIVFGAGVRDNQPSAVLFDRVTAAVQLYRAGVVSQLLMSGDGRFASHNEPAVMHTTALRFGVPPAAIQLDGGGLSTYETCRRAHDLFGVRSAVLVTQAFHLERALLICKGVGIDAVGFVADARPYRGMAWLQVRELLATAHALLRLAVN